MKIDVVLWDIDSTLLDPVLPERNAIRRCFEDFGFGYCTDAMLELYPPINIKWWDRLYEGSCTKQELTVGRFSEFLSVVGLDASKAKEFNDDYMNRLGDTTSFVPNAIETVQALNGKAKQYIVTNGLIAAQSKKITHAGLDRFVDGVFISEEVGFDKPSVKFFEYVFEKTGISDRKKTMIVGDSLTTDMLGGNNAGIVCCWFNPQHKEKGIDVHLDYEIDDLSKVLDYIL